MFIRRFIMKDINFIVGQNIRDLRHCNGLTTKMLAKMLGVSQQQLSRYERGVNKIRTYFRANLTK